ncbi:hypothetical protein [Brunnivagina elsteri]|uniref:Uncharacterized protein n=1 Tax=Brunnivagina elsteri CCALA 953 TaxID=987040 RepID=A0A2A2TAT8_9CYAN|nr:hypothetical protein [Calothrix elsteri]PAX49066.1 hypothetical protein CK510_28015 [Calothrix elsteri CCALA 953]
MKHSNQKSLILILILSLLSFPIFPATGLSSAIDSIDKLNSHKLNNNLNSEPEKQQNNSPSEGILISQKQPNAEKKPQRRRFWQGFGFKNREKKPKVKQKKSGFFSRFKIKRSQQQKVKQNQRKQGLFSRFNVSIPLGKEANTNKI